MKTTNLATTLLFVIALGVLTGYQAINEPGKIIHDKKEVVNGYLRLGDIAPNFKAITTAGEIDFYEWLRNSWGILFSHPADFTPVCTTELGKTAAMKEEFDNRNVKVLAESRGMSDE